MYKFLRFLLAAGVLLAASLAGCQLSAQDAAMSPNVGLMNAAVWFGREGIIFRHPWPGSLAAMFGGIGIAFLALVFYAVRLRRSTARLVIAHGANQLLIDALDKMRAAVVIFDSDMKAVHWSGGFGARFAELVPLLDKGGTLEQACAVGYKSGVFLSDLEAEEITAFARVTAARLRAGQTEHRIVKTPAGDIFDLSMFPLGLTNFASIWVDVTELQREQERIAAQSDALGRKNQQLIAFSAMAAHDLKSPLVQQSALMDFILEDMSGAGLSLPGEVSTHFATFGDLSRRMNLLVGDLLDYAQAESPQAQAECFAPDVRLRDVVALAAPDPRMEVVIEGGMPDVQVSPASFDMVMRNLVGNAAKHHDRLGGRITLRGYHDQNHVIIEVEDDGPGIPLHQQALVFEPFARLTRVEGTGLGLALVRQAVTGWGGEIGLRAAAVRGCVFTVSLPAAGSAIQMETAPTSGAAIPARRMRQIRSINR